MPVRPVELFRLFRALARRDRCSALAHTVGTEADRLQLLEIQNISTIKNRRGFGHRREDFIVVESFELVPLSHDCNCMGPIRRFIRV